MRIASLALALSSLLLPLLLVGLSRDAAAQPAYRYDLLDFEITGGAPFHDDFADGDRNSPPTSSLFDCAGVTSEEIGRLVFTDADGSFAYDTDSVGDEVCLQSLSPFSAGSDAHFSTTWGAKLPRVEGTAGERAIASEVLLLDSTPEIVALLLFGASTPFITSAPALPPACQGSPNVIFVANAIGAPLFACDPVGPSDVTGPIVLRTHYSSTTGTVGFAYSLDGGTSFVDSSVWAEPTSGLDVSALPGFSVGAKARAKVTVVPHVPAPGIAVAPLLLLAGLACLWQRVRPRASRSRRTSTPK